MSRHQISDVLTHGQKSAIDWTIYAVTCVRIRLEEHDVLFVISIEKGSEMTSSIEWIYFAKKHIVSIL